MPAAHRLLSHPAGAVLDGASSQRNDSGIGGGGARQSAVVTTSGDDELIQAWTALTRRIYPDTSRQASSSLSPRRACARSWFVIAPATRSGSTTSGRVACPVRGRRATRTRHDVREPPLRHDQCEGPLAAAIRSGLALPRHSDDGAPTANRCRVHRAGDWTPSDAVHDVLRTSRSLRGPVLLTRQPSNYAADLDLSAFR